MKKIKILYNQKSHIGFEKIINLHLKKGWKTKGNLIFNDNECFMIMYKKTKNNKPKL